MPQNCCGILLSVSAAIQVYPSHDGGGPERGQPAFEWHWHVAAENALRQIGEANEIDGANETVRAFTRSHYSQIANCMAKKIHLCQVHGKEEGCIRCRRYWEEGRSRKGFFAMMYVWHRDGRERVNVGLVGR